MYYTANHIDCLTSEPLTDIHLRFIFGSSFKGEALVLVRTSLPHVYTTQRSTHLNVCWCVLHVLLNKDHALHQFVAVSTQNSSNNISNQEHGSFLLITYNEKIYSLFSFLARTCHWQVVLTSFPQPYLMTCKCRISKVVSQTSTVSDCYRAVLEQKFIDAFSRMRTALNPQTILHQDLLIFTFHALKMWSNFFTTWYLSSSGSLPPTRFLMSSENIL